MAQRCGRSSPNEADFDSHQQYRGHDDQTPLKDGGDSTIAQVILAVVVLIAEAIESRTAEPSRSGEATGAIHHQTGIVETVFLAIQPAGDHPSAAMSLVAIR